MIEEFDKALFLVYRKLYKSHLLNVTTTEIITETETILNNEMEMKTEPYLTAETKRKLQY
jgi:hypothetical protein